MLAPDVRQQLQRLAIGGVHSGQDILNSQQLSAMAYAWGQFIDHDLDLTPTGGTEVLKIDVPTGDPSFEVLLFGSWAEGTARPRSDVDIAIDGTTPVDPKHLAEIRDACDRMATLFTIDLVNLAQTSLQFREGVRRKICANCQAV